MRIVSKALICLLGAVTGYGLAALLGYLLLEAVGVSTFEGERAMTAAFLIGPLGALGGLWGGGWAAQRLFREPTGFGSIARVVGAAFVLVSLLAAIGFLVGSLSSR
ncbi:MAG: hypothetical protein Q8M31_14120 [Beijerinckiaceae bacterium]|nr:hypothetical protein [Beijerinckiaceae bacterium]